MIAEIPFSNIASDRKECAPPSASTMSIVRFASSTLGHARGPLYLYTITATCFRLQLHATATLPLKQRLTDQFYRACLRANVAFFRLDDEFDRIA